MTTPVLDKQSEKQAIKPPGMWNVVFHNDDFTSFELVIVILMSVFNKSMDQSQAIAQTIHKAGKGVVGQYTKELAETKQAHAMEFARVNEAPLMVTIEAV